MIPTFFVWQPSGMSEEHASPIAADTEREAAEEWASKNWESADGVRMDLMVRRPDGTRVAVTVDIDFEPSFTARSS